MDGSLVPASLHAVHAAVSRAQTPSAFGVEPLPARPLEPGMGLAVGRRTVFRPEDAECFGKVADRVAAGNMSLLGRPLTAVEHDEQARLRNAIATGALITSGRHLQHGDAEQASRNMEVFTNCATAIASFAMFYLLLNGSGVGRAYDDELVVVDWAKAPDLLLYLSPEHPDYPRSDAELRHFATELSLLPDPAQPADADSARAWIDRELVADLAALPAGAIVHQIADSREGWAKAVELLESMAFAGARGRHAGARPLRHPPARRADSRHAGAPGLGPGLAAARVAEHPPPGHRARPHPWRRPAAVVAGDAGGPPSFGGSAGRRRPPGRAHGHQELARPRHLPVHPLQERGRAVDRQQLGHGRPRVLAARRPGHAAVAEGKRRRPSSR